MESKIKFFAKGKRSLVFTTIMGKKRIAIKIPNPESKAKNRIENEGKWLSIFNKQGIGPKLLFYNSDMLIYEFVTGVHLIDYMKKNNKKKLAGVFKHLLSQCRMMDKLNIEKKEMGRPFKNVIVNKGKPILIDFERCRKTHRPPNVTQFCQFLVSKSSPFSFDRKKLIALTRTYAHDPSDVNYFSLVSFFGF